VPEATRAARYVGHTRGLAACHGEGQRAIGIRSHILAGRAVALRCNRGVNRALTVERGKEHVAAPDGTPQISAHTPAAAHGGQGRIRNPGARNLAGRWRGWRWART